ncbi:cryptochrome/photolyase family protein [Mangrovitalea sediminis]|uniref:cryptochrome/photolyase family protein n=1 Tax=Mangrovitalea sediminis TaxID=1982043 RepID=UPI000BE4C3AF|nr:cryptochrome/photolyase family protein [Mangrovitalea sediminis]
MTDNAQTRHLILVLGDQLSHNLSALRDADPTCDRILMAEVAEEAGYVNHHKKKIALIFSAMRHFAIELRERGFEVQYHPFTPDAAQRSLYSVVEQAVTQLSPKRLISTECGEYRLDQQIRSWATSLHIPVDIAPDDRFLCSKSDFAHWAQGRKQLRMEFFYREMRQQTGLLMTEDGKPVGGSWNYDAENRRKWSGKPPAPAPFRVEPDAITQAVLDLVARDFSGHFGELDHFAFAVTRTEALQALDYFVDFALPCFGDYQDAMAAREDSLFHSLLSPYINIGLLDPREVCEAAAQAWHAGRAPLNSVEGFIRQIIGWREYVRGLYWLRMPEYAELNGLNAQRDLPGFYWTGDTGMNCLRHCIDATRRNGHAHHIQRLMVTGNFALLIGVQPKQVCDWYLAVYVDAFDWVELPNTLGMALHADGGYLGSKPYAASGKYIQRMSDYCRDCRYKVAKTTEQDACPFNSLYWHFIHRNRVHFADNPRMTMMYRNWERQGDSKRQATLERAETLLNALNTL